MTAIFKENAAAMEAKFLRHVYEPNCQDCQVDEWPCADHRAACTNCGNEASIPGDLHKEKTDRKGQPLRIWWCAQCSDREPTTPDWTYVDENGVVK